MWRRLLAVLHERRGVFILDSTGIPKQSPHSAGVARQYCGALGKIANRQVAVRAAQWTGVRARMLGGLLYLPEAWLTAVIADAEFGDVTAFRTALHRFRLPYAVGVSSHLMVFRGRPHVVQPCPRRGRGRPRTRPRMVPRHRPVAVRTVAAQLPAAA